MQEIIRATQDRATLARTILDLEGLKSDRRPIVFTIRILLIR